MLRGRWRREGAAEETTRCGGARRRRGYTGRKRAEPGTRGGGGTGRGGGFGCWSGRSAVMPMRGLRRLVVVVARSGTGDGGGGVGVVGV